MSSEHPPSINQTREAFEAGVIAREQEDGAQRIFRAREFIVRMAAGEKYTPDDFLYTATLGQTKSYPQESATLQAMTLLQGGELVGVFEEKRLDYIGLTAPSPLVMEVDPGFEPSVKDRQIDRELKASLRFVAGVDEMDHAHLGQIINLDLLTRNIEVTVLHCWGEPSRISQLSPIFIKPKTIAVGVEAILGQINKRNESAKQAAAFITQIAKITYDGIILKAELQKTPNH